MNAIETYNLTKHYAGFSLDNINLSLPSGTILGLIGENGAGKSTTIKLLLEMIRPDSGSFSLLGQEHPNMEEIGVVLDEPGFPLCLNARQLGLVMSGIYQRWDSEAYANYLHRFKLPDNKKYHELSRGMKMKLAIAVALSHHPKLLILDEATNGLDPMVRDEILDLFNDFTRQDNHSILISSHIVSDLEKICDYIAFLHKGKLMLYEEKDVLYQRYGRILCSKEDFESLDPSAVKGKKETPYGIEVIVDRALTPSHWNLIPVNIEDLFIFMAKENG